MAKKVKKQLTLARVARARRNNTLSGRAWTEGSSYPARYGSVTFEAREGARYRVTYS